MTQFLRDRSELSGMLVALVLLLSACAPQANVNVSIPASISSPVVPLASSENFSNKNPAVSTIHPPVASLPSRTPARTTPSSANRTANMTPTLNEIVVKTPSATLPPPKYWPEWPLIPDINNRARKIFLVGQQQGLDTHAFSTIGDCQSEPSVFMGTYDTDSYELGDGYEYLEETVEQFKGSFARDSITVKDGMSVASVLSPAWADPTICEKNETPLDCEIRIHRPIIMFINLGTNWRGGDDVKHEKYMREITDILVARGVVPIFSTKGDNQEGDHRINTSIARVAYDYDLPLWNFWRSIRDLPGKGIDGTRPGGYLTTEAWGRRSFTGLQALDAVWRELKPLLQ